MTLERWSPWKIGVVALTVAVLVFAKQIAFFLVEDIRSFYLWTAKDGLAIVLDTLLLGAALWGAALALRALRWQRVAWVYHHLLVLAAASAALTLLPRAVLFPYEGSGRIDLVWMAVVAAVSFSLGFRRSRLVEWTASLCLIVSPLVVILGFQMATMSTWGPGGTNDHVRPASADARAPAHPIFLFVFDEWSYRRTTRDGEFLAELPNLRRLSDDSFVFRQASAFSTRSMHSLPAILYQQDQAITVRDGQTYWEIDGKPVPTAEVPSLLAVAKTAGYYTALQGFYLPYGRIVGDQADYCRSACVFPKGDSLVAEMGHAAFRNLQWLTDPVTDLKRRTLEARVTSANWYAMSSRMFADAQRLIEDCPRNTMAFFHYPLPHGPFVFNPDGSYHGPYRQGSLLTGLRGSVEDYRRHLQLQDRVVGQIIDTLKRQGRYDDALLIFTADHEWRSDPDDVEAAKSWKVNPMLKRVPLLVKLPGQKARHVIDRPVQNNLLPRRVIDAVLAGRVTEQYLLSDLASAVSERVPRAGEKPHAGADSGRTGAGPAEGRTAGGSD